MMLYPVAMILLAADFGPTNPTLDLTKDCLAVEFKGFSRSKRARFVHSHTVGDKKIPN